MLFSVIIPVYNAEKTIRRCVDSFLGQTHGRAELILVNDGSKDASDQICSDFVTRFPDTIKYIKKENGGPSSARNLGISVAEGDFITFADSDDYVSPDYFDVLERSEDVDFLLFSARTEKDGQPTGEISGKAMLGQDYEQFVQSFVRGRNGSPWNKRFRRSILLEHDVRFPMDLSVGEDFVFCFRALLASSECSVCDKVLYHVDETNGNSVSRRYNPNICEQAVKQFKYLGEAVASSSLSPSLRASIYDQLEFNRNRTCFACVKELFKSSHKIYFPLRKDIIRTLDEFRVGQLPVTKHGVKLRLMQLVIRFRLSFSAYCVAKAQYYRQKLRRG